MRETELAGLENMTACHCCDLLLELPPLQEGQHANCPRCNHLITRRTRNSFQQSLAFASCSLMFLLLSLPFPFLAFNAQGREQVMSIPAAIMELINLNYPMLALLLSAFILIIPAFLLGSLFWILVPICFNRRSIGQRTLARLLFQMQPWSMVEVFMIGTLVSLIKIASMAEVILGLSFWAFILFSVTLTAALSHVDAHQLWDKIEQIEQ